MFSKLTTQSVSDRLTCSALSLGNVNFARMLESALKGLTGKTVGNQPTRPEIVIGSPAPNSTVGTNPSIAFQITTGDHRHPLINLHSITFKLDGVEQGMNTTVVSDIDDSLADGVNLETLTLSLMPVLSPGLHTVDVAVHSGEGQPDPQYTASATWSFVVAHNGGGGDATLPSNKDSIVSLRKSHRNEGDNPLLLLSQRPDSRNKSNNPIVGFDFTDVNLNAGTHTVEFFAHTGQRRQPENSTSVTWSFQVEDVPTLSEKRAIPASQDSIPSARDQISK